MLSHCHRESKVRRIGINLNQDVFAAGRICHYLIAPVGKRTNNMLVLIQTMLWMGVVESVQLNPFPNPESKNTRASMASRQMPSFMRVSWLHPAPRGGVHSYSMEVWTSSDDEVGPPAGAEGCGSRNLPQVRRCWWHRMQRLIMTANCE